MQMPGPAWARPLPGSRFGPILDIAGQSTIRLARPSARPRPPGARRPKTRRRARPATDSERQQQHRADSVQAGNPLPYALPQQGSGLISL
jgi:hypothetical protein